MLNDNHFFVFSFRSTTGTTLSVPCFSALNLSHTQLCWLSIGVFLWALSFLLWALCWSFQFYHSILQLQHFIFILLYDFYVCFFNFFIRFEPLFTSGLSSLHVLLSSLLRPIKITVVNYLPRTLLISISLGFVPKALSGPLSECHICVLLAALTWLSLCLGNGHF